VAQRYFTCKKFLFFSTPEGRVTFNATANKYSYEYVIKDNLGNSRVMFDKDTITGLARPLQEDNFYPLACLWVPRYFPEG
jgi:hypothetical protein